jgi:hypothetical protein
MKGIVLLQGEIIAKSSPEPAGQFQSNLAKIILE